MARWSHCIHGVVDSVSNYVIKWLTLMLMVLLTFFSLSLLVFHYIRKLWATITPAAYVHILVLFNEFYVLWLSFASVRVDGACVFGVCMFVCVLATLTMKLEFRSEVLVFVMLINLCQMCCMCQSSGIIWFHAVKFLSSVFLVSLSLSLSISPSLYLSLFPSIPAMVLFSNILFSFNLNYVLLKLKLHSQLKRCSSTVFERFT